MRSRTSPYPRVGVLLLFLASCASPPAPAPHDPGDRVRFTVAGRGAEPSITSMPYHLFFVVRGPDGRAEHCGTFVPEASDVESAALGFAAMLGSLLDVPTPEVTGARHGDAPIVEAEFRLPAGHVLDLRPGSFYVYRFDRQLKREFADLTPEIRVAAVARDDGRFVELQPAAGPDLDMSELPPGWSPAGR